MLLNEILSEKCFHLGIAAFEKKDIVMEIAKLFEKTHGLDHLTIFDGLWTREGKGSTGLGKGLAIPHARIPNIGTMKLVVIYDADGKNFASYDDAPSKLFFAAIIDEDAQPQEQLELLKTIVETCEKTDLMPSLEHVQTPSAFRDVLVRRISEVQNG